MKLSISIYLYPQHNTAQHNITNAINFTLQHRLVSNIINK